MKRFDVASMLAGASLLGLALIVGAAVQTPTQRKAVEIPAPATAFGRTPVKVRGIPAPGEWGDIESSTLGQAPVEYVVPAGKVFTLHGIYRTPHVATFRGRIQIDGGFVRVFNFGSASFGSEGPLLEGWVAHEGQTVTVEVTDDTSTAGDSTFFLRGWLEDA